MFRTISPHKDLRLNCLNISHQFLSQGAINICIHGKIKKGGLSSSIIVKFLNTFSNLFKFIRLKMLNLANSHDIIKTL